MVSRTGVWTGLTNLDINDLTVEEGPIMAGSIFSGRTALSMLAEGIAQTDQKALVATLSYDGAGNLSAVQDDESRRYSYNGAGNLSSSTDQNWKWQFRE